LLSSRLQPTSPVIAYSKRPGVHRGRSPSSSLLFLVAYEEDPIENGDQEQDEDGRGHQGVSRVRFTGVERVGVGLRPQLSERMAIGRDLAGDIGRDIRQTDVLRSRRGDQDRPGEVDLLREYDLAFSHPPPLAGRVKPWKDGKRTACPLTKLTFWNARPMSCSASSPCALVRPPSMSRLHRHPLSRNILSTAYPEAA
jgi:hypothetical protein